MHDGEQSSSFRYQTQQPPPHRRVENKYRSNKESHHQQPSSISGLAATPCVFSLIEATTAALVVKKKPFVNGSVVRHREALRRARVLTAKDPTILEIKSGAYEEDFEADSRLATLGCRQDTRTFEERGAWEGEEAPSAVGKKKEEEWCLWSPDARALSEAAAATAAQPGGMGAGPRLTLEDVFLNFRDLNLAGKSIKAIDQAFVHFTNLQRLDLGRNNLTALGNLPAGLVALSCAANELSGEALDNIADLPLLSSLDLSYNSLDVDSFLPEAHRKTTLGETIGGSGDGGVFHQRVGRDRPFHGKFPALEHLDLSWNVLCDLGGILDTLRPLQSTLRHLFLSGNPLSILPSYRARVLSGCGSLLGVLDDLRVTQAERATAASQVRHKGELRDSRRLARGSTTPGTTAVEFGGEAVGACSEWGACGHKALDMVHFKVKILLLSNLPCIDTAEVNLSAADGGGGDAVAVPGGRDGVGATTDGEERKEEQPARHWGEVELRIPGNDGNLKSTPFPWSSEFSPPGNNESPAEAEKNHDAAGDGVVASGSIDHVGGVFEKEVWEFGVAAAPSKTVRDGVHFRGLGIFLYGVDEDALDEGEIQQRGDTAPATVLAESASDISPQQGKEAAAPGTPDNNTPQARGGEEPSSCGAGQNNGAITDTSRLRPRRRRRRLVGQGSLPLSSLLDVQWMQEQALRHNHCRKGDDFAAEDAENEGKTPTATGISAKAAGAADGGRGTGDNEDEPCSSSVAAARNKDGGACAVISETFELVLESWVASLGGGGVATSSDDLKDVAEATAERGDDPVDTDESRPPLTPATITVEVTLNSHESIRGEWSERLLP